MNWYTHLNWVSTNDIDYAEEDWLSLDMFTAMSFDATWDASKKRSRKAVDLALHWLDTILPKLTEEEKVMYPRFLVHSLI